MSDRSVISMVVYGINQVGAVGLQAGESLKILIKSFIFCNFFKKKYTFLGGETCGKRAAFDEGVANFSHQAVLWRLDWMPCPSGLIFTMSLNVWHNRVDLTISSNARLKMVNLSISLNAWLKRVNLSISLIAWLKRVNLSWYLNAWLWLKGLILAYL